MNREKEYNTKLRDPRLSNNAEAEEHVVHRERTHVHLWSRGLVCLSSGRAGLGGGCSAPIVGVGILPILTPSRNTASPTHTPRVSYRTDLYYFLLVPI